ncbi:MAG TPA: SRPBCC domain-containing protein [Bryobacteraceae bacterium]|nr:SRPBCC domain-containing protein [Bryobacteraceae bacterium]
MNFEDMTLDLEQHVDIKADIGDVFKRVLHRFGEGSVRPDGDSMNMVLEQWPGGRWFRDRGQGIGHLWGHVQVIKPPVLLELSGPMFMSYPAINHVEIKLDQVPGGTKLTLRHRAIGLLDPAHKQGVSTGWQHYLDSVQKDLA